MSNNTINNVSSPFPSPATSAMGEVPQPIQTAGTAGANLQVIQGDVGVGGGAMTPGDIANPSLTPSTLDHNALDSFLGEFKSFNIEEAMTALFLASKAMRNASHSARLADREAALAQTHIAAEESRSAGMWTMIGGLVSAASSMASAGVGVLSAATSAVAAAKATGGTQSDPKASSAGGNQPAADIPDAPAPNANLDPSNDPQPADTFDPYSPESGVTSQPNKTVETSPAPANNPAAGTTRTRNMQLVTAGLDGVSKGFVAGGQGVDSTLKGVSEFDKAEGAEATAESQKAASKESEMAELQRAANELLAKVLDLLQQIAQSQNQSNSQIIRHM